MPPRASSAPPATSHAHLMCNTGSIFEIFRYNNCNIQKKDRWNTWNKCLKHLRKRLKNIYEPLKHMLATYMYMQHPDSLLQHPDKLLTTFIWNRWSIWDIHLKHTYIAITTCATSGSTLATSIYNACNIPLKLLKHFELYICNMHHIPVRPPPRLHQGAGASQA
jgi:hypothetical protein